MPTDPLIIYTHRPRIAEEFRDNVPGCFQRIWWSRIASYPCQCLLKVCNDVLDVLGSYREPDCIGGDPGLFLFFDSELLVGGGCRVDDKTLGVPDVGKIGEEPEAVNEPSGWPSRLL